MAVQAAERMIRTHGVVVLIGPNRSTHAVAVGTVAKRIRRASDLSRGRRVGQSGASDGCDR